MLKLYVWTKILSLQNMASSEIDIATITEYLMFLRADHISQQQLLEQTVRDVIKISYSKEL